jgi:hypothetical protein
MESNHAQQENTSSPLKTKKNYFLCLKDQTKESNLTEIVFSEDNFTLEKELLSKSNLNNNLT